VSAEERPIVLDANILFSALLRPDNKFMPVLIGDRRCIVSEGILTELFRHKEKLLLHSRLSKDELAGAYYGLLVAVELYKEASIPSHDWDHAYRLCFDVDSKDTPPVALTLAVDGLLWTGDKALKAGLTAKGFDRFFTLP
jgi:predicted nucleic acid-binding protein